MRGYLSSLSATSSGYKAERGLKYFVSITLEWAHLNMLVNIIHIKHIKHIKCVDYFIKKMSARSAQTLKYVKT